MISLQQTIRPSSSYFYFPIFQLWKNWKPRYSNTASDSIIAKFRKRLIIIHNFSTLEKSSSIFNLKVSSLFFLLFIKPISIELERIVWKAGFLRVARVSRSTQRLRLLKPAQNYTCAHTRTRRINSRPCVAITQCVFVAGCINDAINNESNGKALNVRLTFVLKARVTIPMFCSFYTEASGRRHVLPRASLMNKKSN